MIGIILVAVALGAPVDTEVAGDMSRIFHALDIIFQRSEPTVGDFDQLFEPGDESETVAVWVRLCKCPEDVQRVTKCKEIVDGRIAAGRETKSEFLAEIREKVNTLMPVNCRIWLDRRPKDLGGGLRRYRVGCGQMELWFDLARGEKYIEFLDVRYGGKSIRGRCPKYDE